MARISVLDLGAGFKLSGIACSGAFATLLGYLFSSIEQPIVAGASLQASNWAFWAATFTILLTFYTFLPKPVWLHKQNAVVLVIITTLIGVIGYFASPRFADNFAVVLVLSVVTAGAPLWLLSVAGIWHHLAAILQFAD